MGSVSGEVCKGRDEVEMAGCDGGLHRVVVVVVVWHTAIYQWLAGVVS
jgi:hypothetical protein